MVLKYILKTLIHMLRAKNYFEFTVSNNKIEMYDLSVRGLIGAVLKNYLGVVCLSVAKSLLHFQQGQLLQIHYSTTFLQVNLLYHSGDSMF